MRIAFHHRAGRKPAAARLLSPLRLDCASVVALMAAIVIAQKVNYRSVLAFDFHS